MKKITLGISLIIALLLTCFLFEEFRLYGKIRITTSTLAKDIGIAYENYLLDGGDVIELHSQKELISSLTGKNARDVVYMGVTKNSLDNDGLIIDTWGRPFQIKRKEGPKIEIRSAGSDGKFDTSDDIVFVSPREKLK